ncbi:hypothetical protein THASP1DRAFT_15201 [Thamnocephalis sphaerospora]|uniref:F-box domain-containing protein n=1 Tax=Thamnocephalis sphaerospora TaxID=78915 RepID=A0A4P9XRR6_9FUNG|nr:hypothetical protein THASP1DRAFT_15201 [Thamnocephalis sphaerospora]|eukprot:RKP08786.1 hypothetical protein THASP1DRAFT_15201 [Thamnocephalis sphaerospora]
MDIEDTAKCSCSADAPLPPSTARYRTFFDMPREVRLRVFHHLSEMDLLMVSKVCRDWRTLALDGALWRVLNAGAWGHNVTDTQLGVIGTTAAGFLRVANFRGCVQLRPETLKSIAACAPNLETLVLTGCQSLTSAAIGDVLATQGNLRQLDLAGLTCVTEESLATLNAPNLVELNLSRCRKLSAAGMRRALVSGTGRELRVLKLTGCDKAVNNSLLEAIGQHHPQLRHLSVASCYAVTDEGVRTLMGGCTQLERLSLAICHRITDVGARAIGEHGAHITHLDVSGCTEISDAGLIPMVRGCPQLELLDLEDCSLTSDDALRAIATHCPRLRDVSLGSCEGISDDGALALTSGCTGLQRLAVDNCPAISDEVLSQLGSTTQRIEVFDCRLITEDACIQAEVRVPGLQVRSFYAWLAEAEGRYATEHRNGPDMFGLTPTSLATTCAIL